MPLHLPSRQVLSTLATLILVKIHVGMHVDESRDNGNYRQELKILKEGLNERALLGPKKK